ncbi:hypothetical protein AURDEDRAFT_128349 [Auricularia subglabra TFB-10046 SS5]|nr:hypothetical protein AURDEDRAFT_128349 [Auricularia subglabra TFB-10046 SS5]
MPAAPQLYRGRTLEDVRPLCPHHGNTLAVALKALCSELVLPVFTKKRELRMMHQNFEDWSSRLFHYFHANRDNDHAPAAVFVLWSRLLADAALAEKLIYGEDFIAVIQLAVQPLKCDIRILCGLFLLVSTVEPYLFIDFFHYVCDVFRSDTRAEHPSVICNDYGRFLVAVICYGDAWHRREVYTQLACSLGGYTDTRLEFALHFAISTPPLPLSRSMQSYGLDRCDSTRIAGTVAQCGNLLRGLTRDVDLGAVGIRMFCLIRDDPLGAAVLDGPGAAAKFNLPGRPPPLSRYTYVDSWSAVISAANATEMAQEQVDAYLRVLSPGASYRASYIADVLLLQHYLAREQPRFDEWDVMKWAYRPYPADLWVTYAFCVSHAQSDAVYGGEIAYNDFIVYLEATRKLALTGDSPLHILLSLDAAIIRLVLQYLGTRDVLSIAGLCAHWRKEAVQCPSYCRLVCLTDAGRDAGRFSSTLSDARAPSFPVSIVVKQLLSRPWDELARTQFIETALPDITLALQRTRQLDISVPGNMFFLLLTALDARAPLLQELRLNFIIPEYRQRSSEGNPLERILPADVLRSTAPLLRKVGLSGICFGAHPADVFRHVTHLSLRLNLPFQQIDLATHFPALLDLELTVDEDAIPEAGDEFDDDAITLPSSLAVLDLRSLCGGIGDLMDIMQVDSIPEVRSWCEYSHLAQDWKPYLEPLYTARDVTLRVFYAKAGTPNHDGVLVPEDVRASLEYPDYVRTFYADDEGYDYSAEWHEKFASFPHFAFLSPLSKSITAVVVTHEFIPLLFQHFKSLPSLKLLEIDLDTFREGPFWVTHSTDEEGDYSDGDKSPIPWPKPARPGRRRFPGSGYSSGSGEECDDDGYTAAENRAMDRAYSLGALNEFDKKPERHRLACGQLETVRLRSSYEDTKVQTRQLAHFGRALGLLKCASDARPRLLLCGVQLSSAKRGTLHLRVFKEVIVETSELVPAKETLQDNASVNMYGHTLMYHLPPYIGRTLDDFKATCPHTGNALAVALKALRTELGLPAFLKKKELRMMHQNYDDWSARLFHYFDTNRDNDHALAAVFVLWSRLLSDRALGMRLASSNDFTAAVQWAVQPAKCELRVLCGIFLARATLEGYSRDAVHSLPFDLHQPLLRLAQFLYSASLASDYCMLALESVVDAMINGSQTSAPAEADTPQKKLLVSCMELVGTVGVELFVDFFHYVCNAFRYDGGIYHPTFISDDYGTFLIAIVRYGDAWHRREAFVQLACARGGYRDSRLELTMHAESSNPPLLLSRSMRSYGLDRCDSPRISRTITQCGNVLRGLIRNADLGSVGIRLFCLILDDPLGASIGEDAATKFALPERPPLLSGYPEVDSWPAVLSAASRAVRKMTRKEVDGHLPPGKSYTVTYIADVLEVQSYLAQPSDDEWDAMNRAWQKYRTDLWITYALCLSHAQCEAILFEHEVTFEEFIEFLESAIDRAHAGTSPLHVLLLSAIARRAFLVAVSHCCHQMHWLEWRNLYEIADSAAQEYLEACPPDGVDRSAMLEIRIVCHILRCGVPDMHGFQSLLGEHHRAVRYSMALYGGDRTINDTDHALSYIVHGLHRATRWEGRLRAYWPAAGSAEFDTCDGSPRGQRDTMLRIQLVGEAWRSWMARVASAESLAWLKMPHSIFVGLVGTRRLAQSLPSCQSCGLHRSDLRTCAGCREFMYCGQEWENLDGVLAVLDVLGERDVQLDVVAGEIRGDNDEKRNEVVFRVVLWHDDPVLDDAPLILARAGHHDPVARVVRVVVGRVVAGRLFPHFDLGPPPPLLSSPEWSAKWLTLLDLYCLVYPLSSTVHACATYPSPKCHTRMPQGVHPPVSTRGLPERGILDFPYLLTQNRRGILERAVCPEIHRPMGRIKALHCLWRSTTDIDDDKEEYASASDLDSRFANYNRWATVSFSVQPPIVPRFFAYTAPDWPPCSSIADAVDSPGSNPGADATLASDHASGASHPDTLDEDGFVVPKRTVRAQPVARAVSPLSYFSDSGSFFNNMFYDPELEESEQDNEDETPEKAPRKNAGTAWSDYDDGDPFGPIPAGWVIKDPYLGIDSWEPERTSTPVPEQKATVFDDLTEIAMAAMTPKQRKKWRRRQERMVHIQDQGSDTTIVSSDSEGEHSPKSQPENVMRLASMRMKPLEAEAPRIPYHLKGKGRAPVETPGAGSSKYKATVEEIIDEDDPRAAQVRFDEELARDLQSQEDILAERSASFRVSYTGADGNEYEFELPVEQLDGILAKGAPAKAQMQPKISADRKRRSKSRTPAPAEITKPIERVGDGARAEGQVINMMVPAKQMPLNSALSQAYQRVSRARSATPANSGGSPPSSSSSSSSETSSESDSSEPSSASSNDSEQTRKRKKSRRKAWKAKQRKLRLELAATKPDPPEAYNGAASWDSFNEFMILTRKYFKEAYAAQAESRRPSTAWTREAGSSSGRRSEQKRGWDKDRRTDRTESDRTKAPERTPGSASAGNSRSYGRSASQPKAPSGRAKLTKEEREQHRAEGLCFKCHKAGHTEKDCKESNSVHRPPGKSFRAARIDLGEAQIRHQINRAAEMGLFAARYSEPCDDIEFLNARDDVMRQWVNAELLGAAPYPGDNFRTWNEQLRFYLRRWIVDSTVYTIEDWLTGTEYHIDAATLYDETHDLVQWMTDRKLREDRNTGSEDDSVDWHAVFAQADYWRHVAIADAARDAEARNDPEILEQVAMNTIVPPADDRVRVRLRGTEGAYYRRLRYFDERDGSFRRMRLDPLKEAELDRNRWRAGDWDYVMRMQRQYLGRGLAYPDDLLNTPEDVPRVPEWLVGGWRGPQWNGEFHPVNLDDESETASTAGTRGCLHCGRGSHYIERCPLLGDACTSEWH